jgi:predicted Zn finger-like uncharacterized protein
MIIQCGQCKTKFRLDDSRVTDAGVKVRCSRCKNTFVVKKEVGEDADIALQAVKAPESPVSEPEKQHAAEAGFQTEQNNAFHKEENEMFRESGSLLHEGLSSANTARDATANEGNDTDIDEFGFAGSPFADPGKAVEGPAVENRIVEDKKEGSFDWPAADFSGVADNGPDESEKSSIRQVMEEFPGETGRDTPAGGISESPDFSGATEIDFGRVEGAETASDQSWDMFSTATDPESEAHAAVGNGLPLNNQELNGENHCINSTEKCDVGVIKPQAVPTGADVSTDHIVAEGEPEAVTWDTPLDIMSSAAAGKKPSSSHFENTVETDEGDLPPLAITSRREKSLFIPAVFVVALLMVIAAGGAAYYFSWIDFTSLNIPALSSVNDRPASKPVVEITIRNLDGVYLRNVHGGEIFVVTGEALNKSDKALSSIRVQGHLYGSRGDVLLTRPANFFNALSRDQLTALPVNEIEALLKSNTGKSPDNTAMQPGTAATFQIVFTHVPESAGEFGAEVEGPEVVK